MDALDKRRASTRVISITVVAIVLAVIALLIPIPFGGRIATASGDLVHAPLFAALTIGALWLVQYFCPLQPLCVSFTTRVFGVAALMLASGFATEVAQRFAQRSAAMHDVIANGFGILAATLCYLAWHHRQRHPQHRSVSVALLAAAGMSIGAASWAPVSMLRDVVVARRQFPLIASFESGTALERWYFWQCEGQVTTDGVTDGSFALEVAVDPTSTCVATLTEVNPDWTKMKTLELDVVLDESCPQESLQLTVEVIDHLHGNDDADRFRSEWTLKPGQPQHLSITREQIINGPETRQIDLSKIKYLILMVLEPGVTTKFRVDNVRLTL